MSMRLLTRPLRLVLLRVAALTAVLFGISAANAAADEWEVGKVSGAVWVSSQWAQPIAVKTGMLLKGGQTLQTGKNARAFLTHGNDSVAVGPDTVVSVPMWPGLGMTKLIQTAGVIELEVEKLARPHLTVETPYLAAVVKGTHFTVSVSGSGAKVGVSRGLVQVADLKSGGRVDVGAGQQASVTTAEPGIVVTWTNAPQAATPAATGPAPAVTKAATNSGGGILAAIAAAFGGGGDDSSVPAGSRSGSGGAGGSGASGSNTSGGGGSSGSADGTSNGNSGRGSPGNNGSPAHENSGNGNAGNGNSGSGNSGNGNSGNGNGNSGSGNSGNGNGNSGRGNDDDNGNRGGGGGSKGKG